MDHSPTDVLPSNFFRTNKAVMHSTYSNTRQVSQLTFVTCEATIVGGRASESGSGRLRYYSVDGKQTPHMFVLQYSLLQYDAGQEGSFSMRVYSVAPIKLK
jgi:hypothetical protein